MDSKPKPKPRKRRPRGSTKSGHPELILQAVQGAVGAGLVLYNAAKPLLRKFKQNRQKKKKKVVKP